MKIFLLIFGCWIINCFFAFSQEIPVNTILTGCQPVVVAENSANPLRSEVSEWYDFQAALNSYVSGAKQIYTPLFPDTLRQLVENSSQPGTYSLGKVRNHSVGSVFCPWSDMIEQLYTSLKQMQPYRLDSISIPYNYIRFSGDNIADTLVIDIYKPARLLYYLSSGTPKGCSVGYDLANNKGRNYSDEIKILLTNADTISYKPRGKGYIKIGLNNYNINPGSYGAPVGITWSFKPGHSFKITDTLNADWNQAVPHSKINHFFYWNFSDYSDYQVDEYNNGLFIYSFNSSTKYKIETTNGNVYWKGSSFSGISYYPYAKFKITYDPSWMGIDNNERVLAVYPNPSTGIIHYKIPAVFNTEVVVLTDITGQQITKGIVATGEGTLDISALPEGIYVLTIRADAQVFRKTIVKL